MNSSTPKGNGHYAMRHARLLVEEYEGRRPGPTTRIRVSKDKKVVFAYESEGRRYWAGYAKERGQMSPLEVNQCGQALKELMWELHRLDLPWRNRKRKKGV